MNNTDKLLRAFIEASGFDIETLLDYKEKKMREAEAMRHNRGFGTEPSEYSLVSSQGCLLDIDSDGFYTARLRKPIVDYKVTKKSDGERFTFTRCMIEDLIEVLSDYTVASNGHNNDDVLAAINNLETMLDENI